MALIPKLKVGDPFAKDTTMGTLCYREHMDRVLDYIAIGKREGAKLLAGGGPLAVKGFPQALFLQPTLFGEVGPDMRIAREEIFGPVATLHTWDDEAAMLAEANGLDYGLAAGIWTQNFGRAHRLARAVEAGRVWINCYNIFDAALPFGGYKQSGWGREMGRDALEMYTEVKAICSRIA